MDVLFKLFFASANYQMSVKRQKGDTIQLQNKKQGPTKANIITEICLGKYLPKDCPCTEPV